MFMVRDMFRMWLQMWFSAGHANERLMAEGETGSFFLTGETFELEIDETRAKFYGFKWENPGQKQKSTAAEMCQE